jgi:hypothetical protein
VNSVLLLPQQFADAKFSGDERDNAKSLETIGNSADRRGDHKSYVTLNLDLSGATT